MKINYNNSEREMMDDFSVFLIFCGSKDAQNGSSKTLKMGAQKRPKW
jgi:hypothetical protein